MYVYTWLCREGGGRDRPAYYNNPDPEEPWQEEAWGRRSLGAAGSLRQEEH